MDAFVELFRRLDQTTRTKEKLAALIDYFRSEEPRSAAWALWFLVGRRPRMAVRTALLREWIAELSDLPLWMVETCYGQVGDLAETLALLHPVSVAESSPRPLPLWQLVEERVLALNDWDEGFRFALVRQTWSELSAEGRFLYNKLLTGAFRVGVSKGLATRALAEAFGLDRSLVEHRLMGDWRPSPDWFNELVEPAGAASVVLPTQPYPFFLASPLESEPNALGSVADWIVEWKWDGIRAQLIRRAGVVLLWSRGDEMVSDAFPEVLEIASRLPDGTVLDGELLAWHAGKPLPFNALQRRLGRSSAGKTIRAEVPVIYRPYDCLESGGVDRRHETLRVRRGHLDEMLRGIGAFDDGAAISVGDRPTVDSWDAVRALRGRARELGVEGLMLKRSASAYRTGRTRTDWLKWKVDPLEIDAVLVAAQAGHGRRSGLFTDYTFALQSDHGLVTFAKAYSGLSDVEIAELDRWIRSHTLGTHGPVRTVEAVQVFEIGFEAIAPSSRHKCGYAVRFPRIRRWRRDKRPADAGSVEQLEALMISSGGVSPAPADS